MCGRFTQRTPAQDIARLFELADAPAQFVSSFNIAPTQGALVVRCASARERRGSVLRWGLVPHWAKDIKMGARLINARAETVAQMPSFRDAIRRRRCLVPADGFYEWGKRPDGTRQPHYIHGADERPLALAGLWEHWRTPEGGSLESFTILTTTANDTVLPIHDRMPVVLSPGDFDLWLDPGPMDLAELQGLLCPCEPGRLAIHPVSTRVNSPRHNDPGCIEPLPDGEPG